ncbi:hypothetical protein [Halorussus ruber]|uniref:hypothetical protein n=1 Tax=Halorussus ruber TaxID=1126238 RepID=UPI001092D2D8|nr:hypothetical protein [Halorussus ruber]
MSYKSATERQDATQPPYRKLVAWGLGLAVMNGPGLFWLYIVVDALRQAPSMDYWFGPTPSGDMAVFTEYIGAVVLFVVWTALVLALFARPLRETMSEVRA